MKNKIFLLALLIGFSLYSCGSNSTTDDETSLIASVGDKFYIGVAINTTQSSGRDTTAVQLIKKHFNSIVAVFCMKSADFHPEKNRY